MGQLSSSTRLCDASRDMVRGENGGRERRRQVLKNDLYLFLSTMTNLLLTVKLFFID
jgi:hypothetical protein